MFRGFGRGTPAFHAAAAGRGLLSPRRSVGPSCAAKCGSSRFGCAAASTPPPPRRFAEWPRRRVLRSAVVFPVAHQPHVGSWCVIRERFCVRRHRPRHRAPDCDMRCWLLVAVCAQSSPAACALPARALPSPLALAWPRYVGVRALRVWRACDWLGACVPRKHFLRVATLATARLCARMPVVPRHAPQPSRRKNILRAASRGRRPCSGCWRCGAR
jgi:hypothetical protein